MFRTQKIMKGNLSVTATVGPSFSGKISNCLENLLTSDDSLLSFLGCEVSALLSFTAFRKL